MMAAAGIPSMFALYIKEACFCLFHILMQEFVAVGYVCLYIKVIVHTPLC